MSTGLVLDELDVDLPPLATRLVVVIVVVVGGRADTRTLHASIVSAVAVAGRVVQAGGRVRIGVSDVGHFAIAITTLR